MSVEKNYHRNDKSKKNIAGEIQTDSRIFHYPLKNSTDWNFMLTFYLLKICSSEDLQLDKEVIHYLYFQIMSLFTNCTFYNFFLLACYIGAIIT